VAGSEVSGTARRETRAIGQRLDCLNLNLQRKKWSFHRKSTPEAGARPAPCVSSRRRTLRGVERPAVSGLKEMSEVPKSRCHVRR
jgi:hypothetical protein